MKNRIWELDVFRGVCILGMVVVHAVYDITELYRLAQWNLPEAFLFVQQWGGILFLLLSGICATLGRRSVRRGIAVFCCGLLVNAVTAGMYLLDFAGKEILIYFGVLHCLGLCMILWPLFKKLPWPALAVLGAVFVGLGFWFFRLPPVTCKLLMPLGLPWSGFQSSDYFPVFPYLGFFLLGAVLGKTLYRKQKTLFPRVREDAPVLRFFRMCGKYSLQIYLLHQPVLSGIFFLVSLLKP